MLFTSSPSVLQHWMLRITAVWKEWMWAKVWHCLMRTGNKLLLLPSVYLNWEKNARNFLSSSQFNLCMKLMCSFFFFFCFNQSTPFFREPLHALNKNKINSLAGCHNQDWNCDCQVVCTEFSCAIELYLIFTCFVVMTLCIKHF